MSIAFSCALCRAPCQASPVHALPAPTDLAVPARKPARLRQPCACANCGVIIYCCEAHRRIHAQLPGDGGGHDTSECSRMAGQLQRGPHLVTSLPIPWARGLCRLPDLGPSTSSCHNSQPETGVRNTESQPPPASALHPQQAEAGQPGARGDSWTPQAWKELVGRRYSVCEVLQAAWEFCSHCGSRLSTSGGDISSSSSIGAAVAACACLSSPRAAGPTPPGAGSQETQCRAEGVWRRLCSCRGTDDLPPWGYSHLPQLASLKVAVVPGAGGVDPHLPARGTQMVASEAPAAGRAGTSSVGVAGMEAACIGSSSGGSGGGGKDGGSLEAWNHGAWVQRVWRLPATLTPPLECTTAPTAAVSSFAAGAAAAGAPATLKGSAHIGSPASDGAAAATAAHAATASPRSQPSPCSPAGVVDWRSYHQWVGLPLESPAALLLHFPLTLFRALTLADERNGGVLLGGDPSCDCGRERRAEQQQELGQPQDQIEGGQAVGGGHIERPAKRPRRAASQGDQRADVEPLQPAEQEDHTVPSGSSEPPGPDAAAAPCSNRRVVNVIYLGPQAELDCLDCFVALLPLLPRGCTLRVHMVGPDVPPGWHGAELAYDSSSMQGTTDTGGGTAAEAKGGFAGSQRVSRRGQEEHMSQNSSTRIEFSFWSCALHEAPESLLRDCLSAPVPQQTAALSSPPAGPRLDAAPATQLQVPVVRGAAADGAVTPQDPLRASSATPSATATATAAAAAPLVVLAPNAGLPAYMSWMPSLELLVAASRGLTRTPAAPGKAIAGAGTEGGAHCKQYSSGNTPGVAEWSKRLAAILDDNSSGEINGHGGASDDFSSRLGGMLRPVCCLFTAYNEEEVLRSEQLLGQLYGIVPDVACCENPFRQPLWCVERAGNALPSFSNGFMFGWCGAGPGS